MLLTRGKIYTIGRKQRFEKKLLSNYYWDYVDVL